MADDIRETWDEISRHYGDYGSPLRPSSEDIAIFCRTVERWHSAAGRNDTIRLFLCGVTPDIASIRWPFAYELTAMDRVESMVRYVWPGDIPGVRRALVGDWLTPGMPAQSRDVVTGDGGFVFFDYPNGQRALAASMRNLLRPDGLFYYRLYTRPAQTETLGQIVSDAGAGLVESFHAFKWRVAMALQPDSRTGVKLDDVWQACTDARIDRERLPQPGWSPAAVGTIRFYRGRQARLWFPTLDEFRNVLSDDFEAVAVQYGHYELAERCPIVTARPRS